MTVQEISREGLNRLRIICGAMAASLALYVGLAWALADRLAPLLDDGSPALDTLPWILGAMGMAAVLAAPTASRALLHRAVRRGARGSGVDAELLLRAYTVTTIIAFALRETGGVFGLVASLLTGEPLWCLILSAVAFTAMVRAWPSRSHLSRSLS